MKNIIYKTIKITWFILMVTLVLWYAVNYYSHSHSNNEYNIGLAMGLFYISPIGLFFGTLLEYPLSYFFDIPVIISNLLIWLISFLIGYYTWFIYVPYLYTEIKNKF